MYLGFTWQQLQQWLISRVGTVCWNSSDVLFVGSSQKLRIKLNTCRLTTNCFLFLVTISPTLSPFNSKATTRLNVLHIPFCDLLMVQIIFEILHYQSTQYFINIRQAFKILKFSAVKSKSDVPTYIVLIFSVLVLCTQVKMMFVMLL